MGSLIGESIGAVTRALLGTHGESGRVRLINGSDDPVSVDAIVGVFNKVESDAYDDIGRQWDTVVQVTIHKDDFSSVQQGTIIEIDGANYAIAMSDRGQSAIEEHEMVVTMMCSRSRAIDVTRPGRWK